MIAIILGFKHHAFDTEVADSSELLFFAASSAISTFRLQFATLRAKSNSFACRTNV
jgi:hypothetical protein